MPVKIKVDTGLLQKSISEFRKNIAEAAATMAIPSSVIASDRVSDDPQHVVVAVKAERPKRRIRLDD